MSVNVDRHKDALVKAWRQVMDEKDPTNWALFAYEGQTYDLVVAGTGDGGPEELADEFNSGKIMYALCRVTLREKNVDKVALINWQGEGAPLSRKGTCANHIGTVKLFFKGHHVTINARTDEDVEPDVVTQAVAMAVTGEGVKHSGNYEPQAPVGTVYKKVNPKDEINVSAKEEFWKQQEQEDERRKKEQQNTSKKFSQNEVKLLRRESQEYFNGHEEKTTNGNAPPAPVAATSNGDYMSTAEAVKASVQKRDSTSGDLVRQRVKTFDVGGSAPAGAGVFNGAGDKANGNSQSVSVLKRRQMFEGGTMNSTAPPAPSTILKRNPAQEIKEAQALAEKEKTKVQQNGGTAATAAVPKVVPHQVPTATTNTTSVTQPAKSPTLLPSKVVAEAPQVSEIVREQSPDIISAPPQFNNQFRAKSPEVAAKPKSPIPVRVSPVPPPPKADEHHYDEPPREEPDHNGSYNGREVEQEDNKYPDLVGNAVDRQEATSPAFEIKSDMGTCARALYDYQAADDSEISFDPGEVITNIEQIDEGWWEGMGPHGVYGLFPANYVELIN